MLFAFGESAAARFAGAVSGFGHSVGCVGRKGVAALRYGGFGDLRIGLGCRRGHGKTRRGQKVQRGQNFKFNFVTMLNF